MAKRDKKFSKNLIWMQSWLKYFHLQENLKKNDVCTKLHT